MGSIPGQGTYRRQLIDVLSLSLSLSLKSINIYSSEDLKTYSNEKLHLYIEPAAPPYHPPQSLLPIMVIQLATVIIIAVSSTN